MRQFPIPSSDEVQECLLRLLIGYEPSYLTASVRLAYTDLSRTLHGISRHDPAGRIRDNATTLLAGAIENVASALQTQEECCKEDHLSPSCCPANVPAR